MDDLFLVILFVFWIVSGIANAIRRKTGGPGQDQDAGLGEEAREEVTLAGSEPGRGPGRTEGAPAGQTTAEDFFRQLEALARGQLPTAGTDPPLPQTQPQTRPETQPPTRPETRSPTRPETRPDARPQMRPQKQPDTRAETPREPRARSRDAPPAEPAVPGRIHARARRDKPAQRTAPAGPVEGTSLEGVSAEAVRVEAGGTAEAVKRPREALAGTRPSEPAGSLGKATRSTVIPDLRNLTDLPPAELRRILVLQEVLGPPLALRERPPGGGLEG